MIVWDIVIDTSIQIYFFPNFYAVTTSESNYLSLSLSLSLTHTHTHTYMRAHALLSVSAECVTDLDSRQRKMTLFESILTTFELSFVFWGSWGSTENKLVPT